MKIWVDGQCFQTKSNALEIGRYVVQFIKMLSDQDLEIIVSLNGSMQQEAVSARHYLKQRIPNAVVKLWYGSVSQPEKTTTYSLERVLDEKILSSHINSIKPDIALSANPFEGVEDQSSPFIKVKDLAGIKTACIFYDAIPYRFSEIYLQDLNTKKSYLRRLDELEYFDTVLCPSDFTKTEYVNIFNKTNCAVIPAGISNEFNHLVNKWVYDERSIGALLDRYVLYSGKLDWHKNVPSLVQSMANLSTCQTGELKLVLVGDFSDEYIEPLKAIFDEHAIPHTSLVTTGYMSDKERIDLYKNALVAVQPSRMEGFSTESLEAMACGTPFISASGSAVEEVVQNELQMFEPDSVSSLTQLLEKLITDDTFRNEIVEHGYLRLKEFSWEKTAAITMREFEALVKHKIEPSVQSDPQLTVVEDAPRLIMDVTSTTQSSHLSGIQRVMHNISGAMLTQNALSSTEVILSYSQNTKDWYQLPVLSKMQVQLNPSNRITYNTRDSYLLLDRSWEFVEGQRQRLTDVLAMGQEVIHGVHDLGPLVMPAMTSENIPRLFRNWIEFILGYSTGIICVSKSVADELYQLIEDIKLPRPMKIGYFRLGADFANIEPDATELEFTKTRPTFLMVGTIEPRKGQYYALKAFEQLWDRGVDVNLIIIGKAGWNTKMLQVTLENHPEKNKRLFWREDVSDAGLAAAYDEADVLIMTSYLEGFGLPVVEAGRTSCPVILADLPVFHEVSEGAPKVSYFKSGSVSSLTETVENFVNEELNVDYASVEVNWPTWDESALELKDVVLNNNWYKHYEPEQVQPKVKFSDIGKVTIDHALTENETQHTLTIIEGPFLSDDGSHLHIAVAVKNESDMLWSSNINTPGGRGVNLSYHLYDKDGKSIAYDNPRTQIPFVLPPGQEVIMPIKIDSDYLTKGAYSAGIELVQEGVRWFGNEVLINLQKPSVESMPAKLIVDDKFFSVKEPELIFFRGPFSNNVETGKYFIFSVINCDNSILRYADNNASNFNYSFIDEDGNEQHKGIWAVNNFDEIEGYNSGYISLFASAKALESSESIIITYKNVVWTFNLKEQTVSKVITEDNKSTFDHKWLNDFDEATAQNDDIAISFDTDSSISLRGFNQLEGTHVWMSELSSEIDLTTELPTRAFIKKIRVVCSPYHELAEPVELSLLIGDRLVSKKQLSRDFMEYIFELDVDDNKFLIKNDFRVKFLTSQVVKESGGQRNLSICFAKLSLNILTA
ncbi:glycosyltransferase family 1 protein [Pseudoalteromonas sp. 1CM17D]|uniref:glycosyltransferase family 4 protein n=1 Tax=Pseudoalteromonas sp. 1CM17D TaxID=2929162 RepID=UPI0020BE61D8|nr:glycosyltransferase family 1 protein [Pseudoalteromonas sp. 1CM17D]MCK8097409.1 glycosyltransferase family 4 protein [Pseudoalteromonas sp. 1CM17D]